MFRKNARLKSLEARKQLLIAESDLNRAQLAEDLAMAKDGLRIFTRRAQTVSAITQSVVGVVAGVAAFRRRKPGPGNLKQSWMRTALSSAGFVSSLWLALRARRPERSDSGPRNPM